MNDNTGSEFVGQLDVKRGTVSTAPHFKNLVERYKMPGYLSELAEQ